MRSFRQRAFTPLIPLCSLPKTKKLNFLFFQKRFKLLTKKFTTYNTAISGYISFYWLNILHRFALARWILMREIPTKIPILSFLYWLSPLRLSASRGKNNVERVETLFHRETLDEIASLRYATSYNNAISGYTREKYYIQ